MARLHKRVICWAAFLIFHLYFFFCGIQIGPFSDLISKYLGGQTHLLAGTHRVLNESRKYEITPHALWCLPQMMQVNEVGQQCKNNTHCLKTLAEITESHLNHSWLDSLLWISWHISSISQPNARSKHHFLIQYMSTRLDSMYLLALFSAASVWVISSVGDVFMAVGTVFIWAGFKAVYLGPASEVYSGPSQIIVRFMSWTKHQLSVQQGLPQELTMKSFRLALNEPKVPDNFPWMLSDCEELQVWLALTSAE